MTELTYVRVNTGWSDGDAWVEPTGKLIVSPVTNDNEMVGVSVQRTVSDEWPNDWTFGLTLRLAQARELRDALNEVLS